MLELEKETRELIMNYCNRGLVPDESYNPNDEYPITWFIRYFDFLKEPTIEKNLGEAFYQARFCYKLMNVLALPIAKHKALVSIQIIQYASICEAVLQQVIETFYKEEFQKQSKIIEFKEYQNALSKDTHIISGNTTLFLCKKINKKVDIKKERMDNKTKFAFSKGIISADTKEKFDLLYDSRNNVHILKAVKSNYNPKKNDAKNAFLLMQQLVKEVREVYRSN